MAASDKTFRAVLEAKQAELIEALRRREGIVIEKSADEMEEVQSATDREPAIRNLD